MNTDWVAPVVVLLIGGGGIAGIITAIVAWLRRGDDRNATKFDQGMELVEGYRKMVDEYRTEHAKDTGRIESLERQVQHTNQEIGRIKEREDRCQKDLGEAHNRIHILEAKVLELGG